ncbi:MAG: hypothetical protein HYR84_00265 [Planctomycetes bacterium]|nr:hypothetical protein [Planctomycetota bacterium]
MFALSRESGPFRRAFPPRRAFPAAPCWAHFCGDSGRGVFVIETGIGQANVARVLDWLLARPPIDGAAYAPSRLIFAGYAGALAEDLKVGDVMVASEVADEQGRAWPTTWPTTLALPRGRLLTVDQLMATPEDKRRLRERHGACAVDMESAVFASRCTQAGVPFGCVRAISDDAATGLSPALVSLLSGGAVSPWRVLWAILCRPWLVFEFWRLARDTNLASENLAAELRDLLAEAGQCS